MGITTMRSLPALIASSFIGFLLGFGLSRGVTILDLAFITNPAYAHCSITFTSCFFVAWSIAHSTQRGAESND